MENGLDRWIGGLRGPESSPTARVGRNRAQHFARRAFQIGIALLGLLAPTAAAFALPEWYSPFFEGEDFGVPLDTCDASRTSESGGGLDAKGTVAFAQGEVALQISVATVSDGAFPRERYVAHVERAGRALTTPADTGLDFTTLSDVQTAPVCDDLNRDGEVDFAVAVWRHGNGLGASFYDYLVALSGPTGYRLWVVPTFEPSARDFVRFADGEIRLLTTELLNTGGSQPRSYLVYDLWGFRAGRLVPANRAEARFPKWVRMTTRANHAAARELSDARKRELRRGSTEPRELGP